MRWIKRRRIGAGLGEAEVILGQLGEGQPRLQIFGLTFQLEKVLREQKVLVLTSEVDRDVCHRPRRFRPPQRIHVEADIVAHAAGGGAAVTERRCDRTCRLSLPDQHRRLKDKLAGGEAHHIAINKIEIARVSSWDTKGVARYLFGERSWAFLAATRYCETAVKQSRIGR